MKKNFLIISYVFFILFTATSSIAEINISHSIAMHGEPKYGKNFKHVDYVNPNAVKGGKVVFSSTGSFDSFNPFILKGTNSAAGIGNLFETLTTSSSDEDLQNMAYLLKLLNGRMIVLGLLSLCSKKQNGMMVKM